MLRWLKSIKDFLGRKMGAIWIKDIVFAAKNRPTHRIHSGFVRNLFWTALRGRNEHQNDSWSFR
jgi:hypothetical protein